jgi:hypothetical protein
MKNALADAVKAAADGNTVNINNLPPSALRFTDVSDDFYTRLFLAAVEKWQGIVQEVQARKKKTVFKTQLEKKRVSKTHLDLILTQIPADSIVFGNFHPHNGDSVYQKIHVFVGVPVVEQNLNQNHHDNIIGRNTTGSSLTVNSENTRLQLHIAGQPDRSLRFVTKRREFVTNNDYVQIPKNRNVQAVDVQRSKGNNRNVNNMMSMVMDDFNGDDDDDVNDDSESDGDKSERIANTHGNLKTSQPSQLSKKKRKQMERQQEKRTKIQVALQKAEEETKNDLFFAELDEERAKVADEERAKLDEERMAVELEFKEQVQDPRSPLNVRTQCASIVKQQALELFRLLIREGYETTEPRMRAMKGAIDEVEKWLIEPQFGHEVLRELRIPSYSRTKQDKGVTFLKQLAMVVTPADEIGTNTVAIRGQTNNNNIKGGPFRKEQALATLESELAKMRQYLNQLKRLIERYEDSMEDWSDFLADAVRLNAEDNEPEALRRRREEREFFCRVEDAMRSHGSEGNPHDLNPMRNQNDLNSEFKSCPTGDRDSYFNHDDSRFMAALPELLLQQYELSNSHAAIDVLLINEFNRLVC